MSEATNEEIRKTLIEAADNETRAKLRAHPRYYIPLHLDIETAVCLVASLQLSLRHPANTGNAATVARSVIDSVIQRLRDDGLPALAAIAAAGDNPQFDEVLHG